jgi:hypothetical protein
MFLPLDELIDIILDLIPFVIAVGIFAWNYIKKKPKFQSKLNDFKSKVVFDIDEVKPNIPVHENQRSGMAHKDTRDHRIYEQATREALYSESKPRRLSEQKVRMQRPGVNQMNSTLNEASTKSKQLVRNDALRDQNRVRDALLYGEILGTPFSKLKK